MGAGMRDVAVVSFARRVEPLFELDEVEMLAPCIAEALSAALHATLGSGAPVPWESWVVLAVWAVAAPVAAALTFRWE